MKKSFLFLAEGFEETEALTTVDILRRGDMEVKTVSIKQDPEVKGAHGIVVKGDLLLHQMLEEEAEYLIFPGGMPGAQNLSESKPLMDYLSGHFRKKGKIAAICAAPALVLGQLPLEKEIRMTCYPGFEKYLPGIDVRQEGVVIDENIITGRGPGYTFAFALAVLEHMYGEGKAKEVAGGMLL